MQSRRRVIEAARLGVAWLAGLLVAGASRGRTARASLDEQTFAAYIDTLIPDDAGAPGAIRLGIDEQMVAAANDTAMIEEFCRWLDERARAIGGRAFADLEISDREAIVRAAESMDSNSLPYRAFQRTRWDAFSHYYADARSWPAIGYGGPPQPHGFRDYNLPPQGDQ